MMRDALLRSRGYWLYSSSSLKFMMKRRHSEFGGGDGGDGGVDFQ